MRTNPMRSAPAALALLASLALGACGDDAVSLDGRAALLVTVTASQVTADQGRLHIEGATNQTVTLSPGDTRAIDLAPGSYTVSLEGLTGGVVVGYWQRSVTVTEGRQTSLTASLAGFSVAAPSAATQANAGEPVTVSWSGVTGAASYDVEASASTSFSPLLDQQNVTGTSAQVTVSSPGTVFFRVRPRTRFSGVGAFGSPSAGTLIRTPVAEVEVSPDPAQLEVGQTATFTAITKGAGGQILSGRTVTWVSTNTGVATVDDGGQVTARAVGSTTIQATSEGVTGMAALQVLTPGVASVEVNPTAATIPLVGPGTVDLSATARSGTGTVLPGLTVTWRSEDESIATVDGNGRVTAVGGGVVTIVATIDGVEGSATITVDAGQPPAVNSYDVVFLPVIQGCGVGFREFRTDEALTYADNDGNMDPGRTFAEPFGGTPTGVQSQWREEGAADFKPFGYSKGWTPAGGASGTSGGLSANGSTCWSFDSEPTFVDFRVRVRDANGNWSPWFEKRLMMPATVTVNPGQTDRQEDLGIGSSRQYTAEARDVDGNLVPGDPINWSNYTGSPHATVSPTGLYQVLPTTIGGLDHVAARAGYVHGTFAISSGFGGATWFAPAWNAGGIGLATGGTLTFQMRVYEGREYTLKTGDDPNQVSSGDLDLFVRLGQAPTTTDFDDASQDVALVEQIDYTAPADGILYILLYGFSDPAGAFFQVDSDQLYPPQSSESLASPSATSGRGNALGPEADAALDLVLAPAARSTIGGDAKASPRIRLPGGR